MNDAEYIIGLMKTDTAALGFIPAPSIKHYWIKNGNYVIQYSANGRRRGYILHGPPRPALPLKIYQAIIDYDYRLRGFGFLAVRTVIQRAITANATRITLRCATDLQANSFWIECGFVPTSIKTGGKQRKRLITKYVLELSPAPTPTQKNRPSGHSLTPIFSGCPLALQGG